MELKIMTWNVRGSAAFSWKRQIEEDMVNKLLAQNADVVVLTEFVLAKGIDILFEKLTEGGYIWFQTCESGRNGILICVKKDIMHKKMSIDKDAMYSLNEGLDFFKTRLLLKNKKYLSILGCRVNTGGFKKLKDQYDYESKIFRKILLPEIVKLNSFNYKDDIVIVCGDFNNAMCRGNLNTKFKTEDYIRYDQLNYNLNIIKDEFEALGYVMVDLDENGNAMSTYRYMSEENNIPDDHIFIRGAKCEKDEEGKKQCEVVSREELSDHDILLATVSL